MRWYLNRKTSFKLLSAFILVAVILAGVSIYAMLSMKKIHSNVWMTYEKTLVPMSHLTQAQIDLYKLETIWQDIAMSDAKADNSGKLEEIKSLRQDIEKNVNIYADAYLDFGEEIQEKGKRFREGFTSNFNEYNKAYDNAIQAISTDRGSFQQYDSELNKSHEEVANYIEEIKAVDMDINHEGYLDSGKLYSNTTTILITISILTFVFCIFLGLILTRVIARPLNEMANLVEKVAEGDLTETSDIKTKDEVGKLAQSFNSMVLNLRATVQNILSAAENLSASSEQVSASTDEIANASANQANAAQTMNELFRELSDAINAVAQNTEHAAELANKTIKIAQDGEKVVLSSVEGANIVSEQMTRLERDSNRIGEIIEVIDDIADQTNLLALNAAIEAARAGDQGRGFAVVADEVRKLAERSGEATKQITTIIKEMQENTHQSVESVEEGLAFTQQSGEAFEEIINMVNDTGNKVTEIAGASEEQAAQSAEVLTFIESISAATEEASASSEETASTANALTELAEELNASVASFKIN
ncbi:MAG TPA: methyl-accepting chemotaxis protein [Bacillus bacterium]|uniref:Methyl-accepting chemotaxis protein n=1 Tax=Siminovitchia fordii TaxID=254759 RepID=A0ABQ4K083_9BACI|nr:methyl-accepting chemotaxis protein [Siminovitchia fordii]GIN19179.1 methyl-accepting chemotaxis protein [Siminovitchia fordii]HBZ10216.1 methyl-accepting chemotaxis protein [Bacillus sp. (in: firmicutes)]